MCMLSEYQRFCQEKRRSGLSLAEAAKAWKDQRGGPPSVDAERRAEIEALVPRFVAEFANTDAGREHFAHYQVQREEARKNYDAIVEAHRSGADITDQVLLKLLPYTISEKNRDRGAWQCITTGYFNVNARAMRWAKPEQWPAIATLIFDFVRRCVDHPDQLGEACEVFAGSEHATGLQTGSLSPILNALRPDHFAIVSNKSRKVINLLAGTSFAQRIQDYPFSNTAAIVVVQELEDMLGPVANGARAADVFDSFCHWLVAIERHFRKERDEEDDDDQDEPVSNGTVDAAPAPLLVARAQELLNHYLERRIDALHLPEAADIKRQRDSFVEQFGPDRLAAMSGPQLLNAVPYNSSNAQPMDYWLEFKKDDVFTTRLFGGIAGGAATKFGVWQDKKTGQWKVPTKGGHGVSPASEDEAMEVARSRRDEALAAFRAVERFRPVPIHEVDPEEVQAAVKEAAPRWWWYAWLHKYLHITVPELVTRNATLNHSWAELYRIGVAARATGLFALDIHIIQTWARAPALRDLPLEVRSRMGRGLIPRDHFALFLGPSVADSREMVEGGYIALGPPDVGDLTEVFSRTKQSEVKLAVETAVDAERGGPPPPAHLARSLAVLGTKVGEGSIVALMSDPETISAVGEISGSYTFVPGTATPHRVPIRWIHRDTFRASTSLSSSRGLALIPREHPVVAESEASLIAAGHFLWPDFADVVGLTSAAPTGAPHVVAARPSTVPAPSLPPPENRDVAHIVEMLRRKSQVILYGPPGTGKTYCAERAALELVARDNYGIAPARLTEQQLGAIRGEAGEQAQIAMCTFHPGYGYEDFIEGFRPDGAGFSLHRGIFRRVVTAAQNEPRKSFVLIIDEINRGNIPKIFGELITLIEPSKRGVARSVLPLSGDTFTVPRNVYLIGTMNTADRSILLLDTALRRRFAFKELMPQPELLADVMIGDVSLSSWLRALNRRVVEQLGADGRNLQVGHAYFMAGAGAKATMSLRRIADIVQDEVWPLLQEYCYEDPSKLAAILAEKRGIYDRDTASLRSALFRPGAEDELVQALTAIITPEDVTADAELGVESAGEADEDETEEEDEPEA